MPDYDAIVIGAGHNGLTAATVMARGGLRVLCLEKNHFIGGMASTTELIRGYRFELASSIQFPVPNQIFEDLDLGACPIYEPEVQSASISEGGQPPILLNSDPERLLERLGETIGIEAVLGMAEVAAWVEAPAAPSAASTCARPRSRSTRCGTVRPTRPSGRRSGPPCSGASWTSSTAISPTGPSTRRCAACWPSWPFNSTFRGPFSPGGAALPGLRAGVPRGRRRCRRCGAAWAPWPTTWPAVRTARG